MEETKKEQEKTENEAEDNVNKAEEKEGLEEQKGEGRKFPTMKKTIEEVLSKVVQTKKMFKLIKKKAPNKIDIEQRLNAMRMDSMRHKKLNDSEYLNIKDRESTVAQRISQYEAEMQKLEEIRKKIEEERRVRDERKRVRAEERKRKEEERQRKAEEEKKKKEEEEERKKEEEERKKKLEELNKKKAEEAKKMEEERKRKAEQERIQKEIARIKDEEEKRKREEERKRKEEEERKRREEEERKRKEEEERKKREEEERKKREEEERKRKEEEERKRKEEEERKKKEEEERKRKEAAKVGAEKVKYLYLRKVNKQKEEELNEEEKKALEYILTYEKSVDDYHNSTFREPTENTEGRDLKYTFEETRQISTEPLINVEITKTGKIIALSHKDISKITIYSEKTFEEEDCIGLESKVNSLIVDSENIYCALEEPEENILIINLQNTEDQIFLVGHNCGVTDLTITNHGYLVSADQQGSIFVWKDLMIKKTINDFHHHINTITETKSTTQGVAILSFDEEVIKFYDLRYTNLECIETISGIKGSGVKNNMLKLNENILAVAGTYIYIIDLNALIITNMINCVYANDCISNFHFNERGYFFVSQSLTHSWTDEYEKGILAYYKYNYIDPIYPDANTIIKLASKPNSHDNFICSIKQLDTKTIVTGGYDGKIKFWVLKEIKK